MIVGISKRMRHAAGFNFMAGIRITRRNATFMLWVAMFAWLMWKIIVYGFWGLCYMFYGIFLLYKYMFLGAKFIVMKIYNFAKRQILKQIAKRNEATYSNDYPQYKE